MPDDTEALALLLVEDNVDDAELSLRELRRSGFRLAARRVQTEADYTRALAEGYAPGQRWDVILADHALPDFSGERALQLLREGGWAVPFIVVSGAIGEEMGVQFMREGASDYLLKSQLARLAPAVRRALEQHRLRREQQQSAARYRRLFEDAMVGIYQTTPDGRYITANPAVARLLGYDSPAELMASVSDLGRQVYADPKQRAELLRALEAQNAIAGFECEFRRKDGRTLWAAVNLRVVRDEQGTVQYYEGIMEDISARKRVEADLRASEERFAKAFRASPVALTVTRLADGQIVDANASFLALVGREREAVLGKNVLELGIFPDAGERRETGRRLQAEGAVRNLEVTLLTRDGEPRHVVFSMEPIELEGEAHALAILFDNTERKRAEAALLRLNAELEEHVQQRTADLAASAAKFRTLFDVLPIGVSILDDQRRVVQANPALARILKISDEDLAGNPYAGRTFLHPDGTPVRPEEFPSARVLREHQPVAPMEMRVLTETGETIWLDISAAPLPVAGFSAVVATADLTERKRIEAALRLSEEKFAKAFHASGAGIVISRQSDGRILECNDSYLRLVGYERQEVIGRTTLQIGAITPAVREQLVAAMRAGGRVRDMEIGVLTKTGAARTVVTSSETILVEVDTCLLSILYDVTERKRTEEALAHERDQLQALLDNIPDTIYFKDRASRFTRINQAQARLLGLAAPELAIGKTDADFQASPLAAEFFAEEQRLLESGQPVVDRAEFNPTPTGEPRWLSATKVPLKDAAGQVVGLVGISRDVTRRVRAEEDLQRLNQELADRVHELSVLNMLEEQLQSCLTVADTLPVAAQFIHQLFPIFSGALYLPNADRSGMTTASSWGAPAIAAETFEVEACLALGRGQTYAHESAHPEEACPHLQGALAGAALCVPLLAQGEAQGLLHLRAAAGVQSIDAATQQLARVVADNVALTWANLNLRESLREQAIRDPLTGLFNRRFMEESLRRELSRAGRLGQDVSLIMMDIDHFKNINDRFGHEGGDGVLRALGGLLLAQRRGSDIACRYGGEEFLWIMPDAPLEMARQRAEQLRDKFGALGFGPAPDQLVATTLSLGIAAYPQHGETYEAVLRAADAALYQAKRQGRDRTVVAEA